MNELVPIETVNPATPPALFAVWTVEVLDAFLQDPIKKPTTLRERGKDLADFARFLGMLTDKASPAETRHALEHAVDLFLNPPGCADDRARHGRANLVGLKYSQEMSNRDLKSATVGRRLATLSALVKMARRLGRIAWTLDVETPKLRRYRDTTGPGNAGIVAMLVKAMDVAELGTAKGLRDLAIFRLSYDLVLRRGEVVSLDLADVDLEEGTIQILGKGQTDTARMTLPESTRRALADWIKARELGDGPLFVRLDRAAAEPTRLTGTAVWQIVCKMGKDAGLSKPTRPHALRHAGITQVLELNGGHVPSAMAYSRHQDPKTLMLYNDRREDVAGEMAEQVALSIDHAARNARARRRRVGTRHARPDPQ